MSAKRRIVFWIWLMMVVAYLDRVNITVAGPVIMHALHLSATKFGIVLAAFTLGYAIMQVPGGYLADRLGARPLLVGALTAWSVFTALTGLAWSFASLVAIRVLFGLGEGMENGAQFKLIGDNFGSRERSPANALFLTAIAIGPALAAPAVAALLADAGWRGVFYSFAGLGLVVAILMWIFLPRAAGERTGADVARSEGSGGWRTAMRRPATWMAFAAYLFFNVAFWGFLGWMPTYLTKSRGIKLAELGWAASLPYLCGFLGMLAIGWLGARRLYGWRAAMIAVSYLLAALSLYAAFSASTAATSLAGLSAAGFFLYGGFGPFWAITLDIVPAGSRGSFTGLVNLGGQIGGFVAPIVVGSIVDRTHSFTGGFLFMMAALALAAVSLFLLQRSHQGSRALEVPG